MEADAPRTSPTPDEEFAAEAEVAAKNRGITSKANGGRSNTVAPEPPAPAGGDTKTGITVDWHELATTDDGTGDHGNGPKCANMTGLAIKDSGEHAMLRVTVAGVLPGQLVTGEVQGVGVDLYRSGDLESDYQLFFDGGTHGWRALLQIPDGFAEVPRNLRGVGPDSHGGVPCVSLAGREDASVSAFADWSSGAGRLSADGVPRTDMSVG